MARKKQTVMKKIADVVDHVIHPEAAEPQAEKPKTPYQDHMAQWESKAEKAEENKSSKADLDFQMHPKFHKFKGTAQGAE
jgi:hypothetical protein